MSADLSGPGFESPPLSCDGFRARVHVRLELPSAERGAFDRHAAGCRACARLLLEVEQLDDVLLQWRAPDPKPQEFEERIFATLRGDGPTASCTEATSSLHHFIGGDLEPWLAARVERHLAKCESCRDHLDEVQHSRKVWLAWRAPDPAEGFADRIVRRLEPATRAARRRRQLFDLLFGAIPVPRIAAGLVLASLTLLAIGVLRVRNGVATPNSPEVVRGGEVNEATWRGGSESPVLPTRFELPAGRSDPTDSFSPGLRPGGRGTLRRALRGR